MKKVSVTEKHSSAPGQPHSLEALYTAHFIPLCRYIQKMFGAGPPEPEDIVQSAFAKFAGLQAPGQVKNPRALLYTIARNLVLDHKRRAKTINQFIDQTLQEQGEVLEEITPERVLLAQERLAEQAQAIAQLPEKQRRILVMSRCLGLTYAEIAAETGWSSADIGRQLNQALQTLSLSLGDSVVNK